MDICPRIDKKHLTLRQMIAYFLLLLPLFAYPLVWMRPVLGKVPFWGDAPLINGCVTGFLALAVILLYPERVKKLMKKSPSRYWMISLAAAGILAVINHLLFPGTIYLLLGALQILLLPLAGAALSPELRRAALPCGAVTCFILLIFTAAGDRYLTGFTGNWNWNLTMICATIPAATAWLVPRKHPFIISAVIVTVILGCVTIFLPEITPKGTIAAVILATLIAPAIRKINRERRFTALIGVMLAVGFLFFSTVNSPISKQVNDSRFQLWKSSVNLAKNNLFTGCGSGRFESAIRTHMTKEYFFTQFAATRHPHPHNELLLYTSEFGIAGAAIIILFCASALKNASHRRDRSSRWLAWLFILLILHGQVDVLLSTPLAGCWFLLAGGALAARGTGQSEVKKSLLRKVFSAASAAAAVFIAVNLFLSGYYLREGKLLILEQRTLEALDKLTKSTKRYPNPETRYITASTALFNLKMPQIAVQELVKLEREFCGGYLHSYGLTARSLTALGRFPEAKEYFELELKAYPYSALYAGFEHAMLNLARDSHYDIAMSRARLERNLALRGLSLKSENLGQLDHDFDDRPLNWSKLK